MRTKMLTWLLGSAATALLCATCAPVNPPPKDDAGTETVPPAEQLTLQPKPVADVTRSRIEAAIQHVRDRDLLVTNGFWTIFHGILGLGPGVTLRHPETGERVRALDYICDGGDLRGMLFLPTRHGLDVSMGPTSVGQGHQDQFIAEMAQWGMPADRIFLVNGKEYMFLDFVRHAQMRARVSTNQELSWAILVIGQYLGTDLEWTNAHGEKLHFEDLVRYELNASVEQAPCGGTHRLFGLSWAYHLHMQRGGQATGVWKDVAAKTARYRNLAKRYQNADGAFSTDFFNGPGNAADKQLRINTTGHMLEWLALALTDAELRQPWVEYAASALALMILDLRDTSIAGGSLYHAAHGLLLYYARRYDRETLGPAELLMPPPPAEPAGGGDW